MMRRSHQFSVSNSLLLIFMEVADKLEGKEKFKVRSTWVDAGEKKRDRKATNMCNSVSRRCGEFKIFLKDIGTGIN